MGNCRSREPLIKRNFAAKLILLNGKLLEFTHPIKASLLMEQNPNGFICSADGMEFGQQAVGVSGDEVLRPGEVYFELPIGWRSHRMKGEEMAELAARASAALSGGGCDDDETMIHCGCCASPRSKVEPVLMLLNEATPPMSPTCSPDGGGKDGGGGCKQRRHKFVADLSAITEE